MEPHQIHGQQLVQERHHLPSQGRAQAPQQLGDALCLRSERGHSQLHAASQVSRYSCKAVIVAPLQPAAMQLNRPSMSSIAGRAHRSLARSQDGPARKAIAHMLGKPWFAAPVRPSNPANMATYSSHILDMQGCRGTTSSSFQTRLRPGPWRLSPKTPHEADVDQFIFWRLQAEQQMGFRGTPAGARGPKRLRPGR